MRVPSATGLVFASLAVSSGSTLAAPAPPSSPNPAGPGSPNPNNLNSVKSPRPNGLESPHLGSPRMMHQAFFNARSKLGPPAIRSGSGSRRSTPYSKKREASPSPQDDQVVSAEGLHLLPPDLADTLSGVVKTVGGALEPLPIVGGIVGPLVTGLGDTLKDVLARDETHIPHSPGPSPDVTATPMVRSLAQLSLRDESGTASVEGLGIFDQGTSNALGTALHGVAEALSTPDEGPLVPLVDGLGHIVLGSLGPKSPPQRRTIPRWMRRQVSAPVPSQDDTQTLSAEGLGLLPPDLTSTVGGLVDTVVGVVNGVPIVGPTVGGLVGGLVHGVVDAVGSPRPPAPAKRAEGDDGEENSCDDGSDCDSCDDNDDQHDPQSRRSSYIPFPQLQGDPVPGFASAWGSASSVAGSAYDQAYGTTSVSPQFAEEYLHATGAPTESIYNAAEPYFNAAHAQVQGATHGLPFMSSQGIGGGQQSATQVDRQRERDQDEEQYPYADTYNAAQDMYTGGYIPAEGYIPQSVSSGYPPRFSPSAAGLYQAGNGLFGTIGGVAQDAGDALPHHNAILGFLPNGMPVFAYGQSQASGAAQGRYPQQQQQQRVSSDGQNPVDGVLGGVQSAAGGAVQSIQNAAGGVVGGLQHLPVLGGAVQNVQNVAGGILGGAVQTLQNSAGGVLGGATGILSSSPLGNVLPLQQLGGTVKGLNLPLVGGSGGDGLFGLFNADPATGYAAKEEPSSTAVSPSPSATTTDSTVSASTAAVMDVTSTYTDPSATGTTTWMPNNPTSRPASVSSAQPMPTSIVAAAESGVSGTSASTAVSGEPTQSASSINTHDGVDFDSFDDSKSAAGSDADGDDWEDAASSFGDSEGTVSPSPTATSAPGDATATFASGSTSSSGLPSGVATALAGASTSSSMSSSTDAPAPPSSTTAVPS